MDDSVFLISLNIYLNVGLKKVHLNQITFKKSMKLLFDHNFKLYMYLIVSL